VSTAFKLVTTESSRDSNPGPPETNAVYTEIVQRIEELLSKRAAAGEFQELSGAFEAASSQQQQQCEKNGGHSSVYVHIPAAVARISEDPELSVKVLGPGRQPIRIHSEKYLARMRENTEAALGSPLELLEVGNSAAVDGSKTETAARIATAALVDVSHEVIFDGQYRYAFALNKPPTHHALGNAELARFPKYLRPGGDNEHAPIGFCHLNGIATAVGQVLARSFPKTIERIAILDFDVHHGNGNEDTFWNDPRVLTISLHEEGLWPGPHNGRREYTGHPEWAPGSALNIPIPPGSGDAIYVDAIQKQALPKLDAFDPQVIFVAAGFDAMHEDGYADQELSAEWYGWCVQELRRKYEEKGVPMILNLEGGYNAENVESAVGRVVDALATPPKSRFELKGANVVAADIGEK